MQFFTPGFTRHSVSCHARGSIVIFDPPIDNAVAKNAILADPNFTKQIDEDKRNYDEIVKSLWIIPQNRMEALFGPAENPDKITRLVIPPDFVLPVLRNACVGFPNPPGDSKVYFYRVGNLGRIWEVTDTTGQKGCFFLLCLKTDSTFNPLRTKSDFLPRRKWDLEHLDALRKLIKKALTK